MTQPQTEMVELEPCPFCGGIGHPYERRRSEEVSEGVVECGTCGCEVYGLDEGAAIRRWNARTIAPDIEELVGALERIGTRKLGGPFKGGQVVGERREMIEIARAALSKFTNTKGNDLGEKPTAELIASTLSDLECELLLGSSTIPSSGMSMVGADLVEKGLGRRDGRGSIYFDTPLGVQVAAELIASTLSDLECELLLGSSTNWGSWMSMVGADLVEKGLGRRDGRGSIYFDTPLGVQVAAVLRARAAQSEESDRG